MPKPNQPIKGRGASSNPAGRFEKIEYVRDPDTDPAEWPKPETEFYRDDSKSVISYNESPDVSFDASINPYRGCEHGCAYCYARPHHEYLGLSAGLDFETRIFVKEAAPALLRRELSSRKWNPQVIGISGVTDAYQPIERRLKLTRQSLEVLAEFRNPVTVVTKNHLVARDSDLFASLASHNAAAVIVSVTTLDPRVARTMEPRTSSPDRRLETIAALTEAGIPVGVLVAPVVPGLTDEETPKILKQCARAGATFAGYIMLRLPHGVKSLFESWLAEHLPDRRERVMSRIRSIRAGKLNDSDYETRGRGTGPFAEQNHSLFELARRREGLDGSIPALSVAAFRRPGESEQLDLL